MIYIKKTPKINWDELEKQFIELCKKGRSSTQISSDLNINSHAILKIIKRCNIQPIRFKTYTFNENYFEKIDSSDKAYFLGLLYADGNVYEKRNRVQITLVNSDSYILRKWSRIINYKGKLYIDREKYSKLILPSKKMCNDLIKLGCVPRKSLILKFPTNKQVPKKFISHFIRGAFDGDGGINKGKSGTCTSFTSTKEFLDKLKGIFLKIGIHTSEFKKRYKDKEHSAGSIYIGKIDDQRLLYKYLYKNCEDLFLTRKKYKFGDINRERINRICETCGLKHFAKNLCKKCYRKKYHEETGK